MKYSTVFLFLSCIFVTSCSGNAPTGTQKAENKSIASIVSQEQILPTIPNAVLERTEEERFAYFVEQIKIKAQQKGIKQSVIDEAFANVVLLKRVISSDKNQLEKKITLDDYLNRVLTQKRKVQAKEKYKEHHELLNKVSVQYGVPANYIVALWGMESGFGRIQGKEDIISAMTSLAFEGRREVFFTNQLMAALQILQDGHIEIDRFKGSWAGAMGQCQFMPSSFIKYGADGDGDGKVDIWHNQADVFSSIANYLATEGWNKNIPWGREVTLPENFDVTQAGLEDSKVKSVAQWRQEGIKFTSPESEAQQQAWIILPDDMQGRAFIVYSNFKTLMHWNRSYYFGISVGMLADSIIE